MDMSVIDGYEYREKNFPESVYEDGDFDIKQLYDGIVSAYADGYKDGARIERFHYKSMINVTLDKVEEFFHSILFDSCRIDADGNEVPDEIITIKYHSVKELMEAMREFVFEN